MSKRISVMFVVLSILVNFVGCVGYGRLTPIDSSHYVSQPVDENKDGVINEEDVKLLEQKSSEYFGSCAIQYKKGGIELGKEKDIPLIYILRIIDTEENIKTLEENLTVAEWKKLVNGRDELNRFVRQLEATKAAINDKSDFGVVTGLLYYPDQLICALKDGRAVMLIGISVPNHASRYRKMSDDLFYRLALGKKAKIEYDVMKSGDNFLYGYIYVGDVCVNAEMVYKGYAWAKPDPQNNKYDKLFMKLEKEAKENKRGFIWKPLSDINQIDENDSGVVGGLSPDYPDRLICELRDCRLIKLIGISVPNHASKYRKMSDDMLCQLTLNKLVKIKYDVLKSEGDFLLGYIYIGDVFVNEEMVSKGYARARSDPQNSRYDPVFVKLEKEAKENKLGIWAFTDDF